MNETVHVKVLVGTYRCSQEMLSRFYNANLFLECSNFKFMYVYVWCICVWYVRAGGYMHREALWKILGFLLHHAPLYSLENSLSLKLELASFCLGKLDPKHKAIVPSPLSSSCPSSTGVTDTYCHTEILHEFWGYKLRSSCSQAVTLTYHIISPGNTAINFQLNTTQPIF